LVVQSPSETIHIDIMTPEQYYDICKIAVQNDGLALQFVPDQFKFIDLCKIAVQSVGDALKYVPQNVRDNNDFKRL
jgi:hypothetical protein